MRKAFVLLAGMAIAGSQPAAAQMTFFVSSEAPPPVAGKSGVDAADEQCEYLGYSAGLGDFEWRAYMDVPARNGQPAISAADRIGDGPWYNFGGALVADTPDDLKAGRHNITRQTAMDERGFTPYSGSSAPSPAELVRSAQPDSQGRFFCFASP